MQAVFASLAFAGAGIFQLISRAPVTCICEANHDRELLALLGKQLDRCIAPGAVAKSPGEEGPGYIDFFFLGVSVALSFIIVVGWQLHHRGIVSISFGKSEVVPGAPPIVEQRRSAGPVSEPAGHAGVQVARIGTPSSLRSINED